MNEEKKANMQKNVVENKKTKQKKDKNTMAKS